MDAVDILERLKAAAAPLAHKSDPPLAVFVLGGCGVGKTDYIEKASWRDAVNREEDLFRVVEDRLLETSTFHFDVDKVWHEVRRVYPDISNQSVRAMAVEIGRLFTDYLLDTRVNFVTEGVGASDGFLDFLTRLKRAGYTVHIIEVTRNLDAALAAVATRNTTTARKVSPEAVCETHALRNTWRDKVKKASDFYVTHEN